jgi:chondroitin AC lyase
MSQRGGGLVQIRRQFVEYHAGLPMDDAGIQADVDALSESGTWPDINYASTRRGNWEVWDHMTRIVSIASAYVNPQSIHYKKPEIRAKILRALQHWLDKDYRNENWWYERIGIPEPFLTSLILLGDDVPNQMVEDAKPILDRSTMGMTGQNKIWCAGIALMKGLVYGDCEKMQTAADSIWSELRVTTDEGIQPDWSYHQHGAQLQFGNYGLWFGKSVILWASSLRDTPYAIGESERQVLRGYLLHGPSWVMWNGRFDLGACARQLDDGCQLRKGGHLQNQLAEMTKIDPEYATEYTKRFAVPNELLGFRAYPRSDFAVQRRREWYASLKMSSKRLICSENTNSENAQGLHLSDGMLLLGRSGMEYEDIQPLWDWKRLPGTTCSQGVTQLAPTNKRGGSDFCGMLGDGKAGMAAMIYKRGDLEARKAWFFGNDAVICLGAGIGGTSSGPVYTSVQQALLDEEVVTSKGTLSSAMQLPAGAWVHHNGIGYLLLNDSQCKIEQVKGNWLPCFPTRGDRRATGDVFSLWIDHGISPAGKAYAYMIYPQAKVSDMDLVIKTNPIKILSNTRTLQAIKSEDLVQAVFYEAGTLTLPDGTVIKTSALCLLSLMGRTLTIVDPTQRLSTITVSINEKKNDR